MPRHTVIKLPGSDGQPDEWWVGRKPLGVGHDYYELEFKCSSRARANEIVKLLNREED